MSTDQFTTLEAAHAQGGVAATLEALANQLRADRKHHELFEALKMQVRLRLGLPLLYGDSSDDLDEQTRNKLEDGLIAACRDVGTQLMRAGRVREGWMYLRPVGDKKLALELLAGVEADEDNVEEMVDVCLREAVDVHRGFSLVLKYFGTCNAITTFEGELPRHTRTEQQIAAGLLLEHLYQELSQNLRGDIGRQSGATPTEVTIRELVVDRPWLFQEMSYHVDTTHLSSVVRFARLLQDARLLRLALDLTEYGRRLHTQFQYAGEAPFEEVYPSHALFFQALLGENLDEAMAYFRGKAEASEPRTQGTAPIEVYVDLLARVGRPSDAIDEAIRLNPEGLSMQGLAPTLLELAQQAGSFDRVREHCRQHGDILGFTASLVKATRK